MCRLKPLLLTHPLCANCTVVSNRTILKVRFLSWQRFPSKQQYAYFYLILNYPTGQLPQAGGLMYAPKIEARYMHSFITENSICPFVLTAGRRPLYCLVLLYYNIQIQRGLAGSVCLTLWPSSRWAISSLSAPVFCSAELHLRFFNYCTIIKYPSLQIIIKKMFRIPAKNIYWYQWMLFVDMSLTLLECQWKYYGLLWQKWYVSMSFKWNAQG